jgi:hypothetical protein
MSFIVAMTTTTFVNKDGEKSFGYRIYDDHDNSYNNMLTEEQCQLDDMDFLNFIVYNGHFDDRASDMLGFVKMNEMCMIINGEVYEWDEIKETLSNL